VELRFLVEVQKYPMDLRAGWEAALEACGRLHAELGTPLERLRCIEDLFVPENPAARFSLWHAVCVRPNHAPDIKIYLNPQARAPDAASALIKEALRRLGLAGAWRYLCEAVRRPTDRLSYLSLDLSSHDAARVKIYLAHPGATVERIERLMATDPGYTSGAAAAFCRAMLAGEGPFEGKPILTCYAFTGENDACPHSTTLHLPIRDYVDHDLRAAHRILEHLGPARRATFQAALSALADRPLEAGVGLIQWASFKRRAGHNRTTFYLSPELYEAAPPRGSRAARPEGR
jgi:DMATS type aromatic prenyltransferase